MADVPSVNSGNPLWQAAFSAALGVELVKNSLPCHGDADVRTEHAARQAIMVSDKVLAVVKTHDAEIEKQRHAAAVEIGKGLLKRKFYHMRDASPMRVTWVVDSFDEENLTLGMRPESKPEGTSFYLIPVYPYGWDRRDFALIEEPDAS